MKPYSIHPSGLRDCVLLVETQDLNAAALLRSLQARVAPGRGWFLRPSRVRIFERFWQMDARLATQGRYRFPDGKVRTFYQAREYARRQEAGETRSTAA